MVGGKSNTCKYLIESKNKTNKRHEFIKNQIMLNCREKKAVDITYSPFQGFSLFSMILLLPNGESRYR